MEEPQRKANPQSSGSSASGSVIRRSSAQESSDRLVEQPSVPAGEPDRAAEQPRSCFGNQPSQLPSRPSLFPKVPSSWDSMPAVAHSEHVDQVLGFAASLPGPNRLTKQSLERAFNLSHSVTLAAESRDGQQQHQQQLHAVLLRVLTLAAELAPLSQGQGSVQQACEHLQDALPALCLLQRGAAELHQRMEQSGRHVELLQRYQASLQQATLAATSAETLAAQRKHTLESMLTAEKRGPVSSIALLQTFEQLRTNVARTLDASASITNARAQTAAAQAAMVASGLPVPSTSFASNHDVTLADESSALPWYTLVQLTQNLHAALADALRAVEAQPAGRQPQHQAVLQQAWALQSSALSSLQLPPVQSAADAVRAFRAACNQAGTSASQALAPAASVRSPPAEPAGETVQQPPSARSFNAAGQEQVAGAALALPAPPQQTSVAAIQAPPRRAQQPLSAASGREAGPVKPTAQPVTGWLSPNVMTAIQAAKARGMDMNQLLSVYAPIMAPAPSGPEQRRPAGASRDKSCSVPLLAGNKRPAEGSSSAAFKAWQPVACKAEPAGDLPLPRPSEQPQDRGLSAPAGGSRSLRIDLPERRSAEFPPLPFDQAAESICPKKPRTEAEQAEQRAQIKEALQAVLELTNPALLGGHQLSLSSLATLPLGTGLDGQPVLEDAASSEERVRTAHDKLNAGLEMLRRLNLLQPTVLSTILAKHPTLRLVGTDLQPQQRTILPIAELQLPSSAAGPER